MRYVVIIAKIQCQKQPFYGCSNSTKIVVRWGFAPDPTGGAYSAPSSPPSWIQGALLLRGWEERGREGRTPDKFLRIGLIHGKPANCTRVNVQDDGCDLVASHRQCESGSCSNQMH